MMLNSESERICIEQSRKEGGHFDVGGRAVVGGVDWSGLLRKDIYLERSDRLNVQNHGDQTSTRTVFDPRERCKSSNPLERPFDDSADRRGPDVASPTCRTCPGWTRCLGCRRRVGYRHVPFTSHHRSVHLARNRAVAHCLCRGNSVATKKLLERVIVGLS